MIYYVTITAKRKDGKRHIAWKFFDLAEAKEHAVFLRSFNRYIVGIYTGNWKEIAF